MGNPVVHFEVGAADAGPLVAFYGELFGWGLEGFAGSGYTMADTRGGEGINGGIGRSQTGEPWSAFYVEAEDPQVMLDKASALGGTTVMPVTDFGGAVTIAMFTDLDGLLVGLVKAPAVSAEDDEPAPSEGSGAPVTWFEILGSDPARTQQFYADLFGWTMEVSGAAAYAVANTGTERGIMGGIGGGEASRWTITYARVADVDQTLGRVEALGGSVISDPGLDALKKASRTARYDGVDDGMKTAVFRDPAGNAFGIFQDA